MWKQSTGGTVYAHWLQSAHSSDVVCKCKVGASPVCNSQCKQHMCTCNGIDPLDALKQWRNGYQKQANILPQKNNKIEETRLNTRSTTKKLKEEKAQSHFHKFGLLALAQKNHKNQNLKKKESTKSDSS